jgi:hypothetical protein
LAVYTTTIVSEVDVSYNLKRKQREAVSGSWKLGRLILK